MKNNQALREAANNAEPEVWIGIEDDLNADGYSRTITRFIQHCSPDTVLALLNELERENNANLNLMDAIVAKDKHIADLEATVAHANAGWKEAQEQEARAEAAERRIAELEARPANPINFKENADADYCRGWAWNEVKKELASEAWTVGDNCTYYGFFCWGWDSRRQFNEQRAAGITVKGE
ncbi:ead/Ea22-like family protein [Lelliottia wanjuensis]|uniref:Ead/Ea22-like family protein n=1 Tax=Lelliottia wanjuensis TaxID=3050585 RepID=A0AAP4D381_9ENTR|nr:MULTISPECIES: ead/Ea22-like family protein [unclassified Lelliottia]MDK9364197.1 ead/Ea22-like family protein [Lelliottia sp. V106_12]MDK9617126.1 ead/Ea22-like family protein [Lelliottia sp. V106_9]